MSRPSPEASPRRFGAFSLSVTGFASLVFLLSPELRRLPVMETARASGREASA